MGKSLEQIVDVIVGEVRAAGLSRLDARDFPPPADHGAEREVLAAVLEGHVQPSELEGLDVVHFDVPLHRTAWAAAMAVEGAGGKPELEVMVRLLERAQAGDCVRDRLETLRDTTPAALPKRCALLAARLMMLARARRLVEACDRVSLGVRSGSMAVVDALLELDAARGEPT